jgi:hypothetical protein
MFNSISWQEFLNAALTALAAYYLTSVLIFYSKDLLARFKGAPESEPVDSERRDHPLMGQIRKDTPKKHEHVVEAHDVVINPVNWSNAGSEEDLLKNSLSHLLLEAKVLAKILRENNVSKADATPMFQSLLSNYVHLSKTKYRDSIMGFIHDTINTACAFEVTLDEIDTWWPREQEKDNN